eukprot:2630803-Alexandrium_andersonii.AAC.1
MSSLGVNWEDGRAAAAPLLDGLSWESRDFSASPSQGRHVPPGHGDDAEAYVHLPIHEDCAAAHGR